MTKKKIVSDPPTPPVETTHPFHPGHKLKLVTDDQVQFDCDGCKEPGAGARYTCAAAEQHDGDGCCCDFDLHTCCALAPDVLEHPLFDGCGFVLLHEPPAPERRICDACGDQVRGFVYHCFDVDLDIHPCCALLPPTISLDGLVFDLCNEQVPRGACVVCAGKKKKKKNGPSGGQRNFWSYRSDDWDGEAECLHVACVKEMVRRTLKANHHRVHDGGGKILGAKAPALEGVLKKRARASSSSSGVKRFLEMVGFVIRIILGAIVGDPTAMIAAVVGVLFSGG